MYSSFAGDQAVDTVESERHRIVLTELEPEWWILAVSVAYLESVLQLTQR